MTPPTLPPALAKLVAGLDHAAAERQAERDRLAAEAVTAALADVLAAHGEYGAELLAHAGTPKLIDRTGGCWRVSFAASGLSLTATFGVRTVLRAADDSFDHMTATLARWQAWPAGMTGEPETFGAGELVPAIEMATNAGWLVRNTHGG